MIVIREGRGKKVFYLTQQNTAREVENWKRQEVKGDGVLAFDAV
jgi:hypothetical protein